MSFPGTHYHIRWSSSYLLDWQAFKTHAEAEARAKELVREGEAYTIETAAAGCEACSEVLEQVLRRQAAYDRTKSQNSRY